MSKVIITEKQLTQLVKRMSESNHEEGSYMAKQQLFTIATLAYKMWEIMEEGEQLEDWMESKIAQADQMVTAVVKSYMYDEISDELKKNRGFNPEDLVIGM
jgi:hypothetical protein